MDTSEKWAAAVALGCREIESADEAPRLADLAATAGLSADHFHRIYKCVTGVTPKAYAAAHRARRVRKPLSDRTSVTDALYEAGFNSTGRFYESSQRMLGMTPTEFRARGAGMRIRFAVGACSLGSILVAATDKGVCTISLGDDAQSLVNELENRFARAARGCRPRVRAVGGNGDGLRRKTCGRSRSPARHPRHRISAARVAGAARITGGFHGNVYGNREAHREAASGAGSRRRLRRQHARRRDSMSPRHALRRIAPGYRWGVERKRTLLDREAATAVLRRRAS